MLELSADYLFTGSDFIKNGWVRVNDEGIILETGQGEAIRKDTVHYKGILCPGFINAHCHLELSHLKGKISKHTGLIAFIKALQNLRETDPAEIEQAIRNADSEMLKNGIVAVADISNTSDSFPHKQKSLLFYHTFIELFGFDPAMAANIFSKGNALRDLAQPLSVSLSIHAPYSVSPELMRMVAMEDAALLSIHNQETADENVFFREKKGAFAGLYQHFKIAIDFFQATGQNSLPSTLKHLPQNKRLLLVHNTFSNEEDLAMAENHAECWWCLCPNANLYIEHTLPDLNLFLTRKDRVVLGTDSLASNDYLSILEEIKTIQKFHPQVSLQTLLQWGTWNGARALKLEKQFGRLEKGKQPGINLLTGIATDRMRLTADTAVLKIV